MGWSGGAGWASVGMVGFWVMVAIAVIALLPGVQNDQAHRRMRQIGYLR